MKDLLRGFGRAVVLVMAVPFLLLREAYRGLSRLGADEAWWRENTRP